MSALTENFAEHRFELPIDGSDGEIAAARYRVESDRLILTHTEVPYSFSGQGVGAQFALGVFDAIRATGRKAVLRCSFMGGYYAHHPEYSDIVVGQNSWAASLKVPRGHAPRIALAGVMSTTHF